MFWSSPNVIFSFLIVFWLRTQAESTHTQHENNTHSNERLTNSTYDMLNTYNSSSSSQTRERAYNSKLYDDELLTKQDEARRQRKLRDIRREKLNAVKQTLQASKSEACEFLSNPLDVIRGNLCGKYYKILHLDRRAGGKASKDKSLVKKSYRKLSLAVHPDKNPSQDAEEAFQLVQSAYACLTDSACQEQYDAELIQSEELMRHTRTQLKQMLYLKAVRLLRTGYLYSSLAAAHMHQVGTDLWALLGNWHVTLLDEQWPLGRPIAAVLLLWKGRALLTLFALSAAVVRINTELDKSRQESDHKFGFDLFGWDTESHTI